MSKSKVKSDHPITLGEVIYGFLSVYWFLRALSLIFGFIAGFQEGGG